MRRLFDATGMQLGAGMAEAMRRMEAGEDPDRIEAELGDVLEQEDPFAGTTVKSPMPDLKALRRELMPPTRDETRQTRLVPKRWVSFLNPAYSLFTFGRRSSGIESLLNPRRPPR